VAAALPTQVIRGTARVTFYDADGSRVTDRSADLKNGTATIQLPLNFRPGVYTVIAEYLPVDGAGPASTSQPVTWTVTESASVGACPTSPRS
jgi:hypothetical protein